MLTPSEQIEMDKLMQKSKSYIPMTDEELQKAEQFMRESCNIVGEEMLIASEPWKRICARLQALSHWNRRLLTEIAHLKSMKVKP